MNRILDGRRGWLTLLLVVLGAAQAQAQNAVITGRVTSDQGQPLTGANVFITELNVSVGTGPTGNYSITIPAARVSGQQVQLRARSVGFIPQARQITITAGSRSENFSLRPDVTKLSEVVVTGVTGATERAKVPFSVARVDTSDMPVVAMNPLTQLQGKVTGASISSVSGRPGSTPAVLLRGPTSINAAGRAQSPLYVVDGVLLQGSNPLGDLNPADIESVEVVKGAAAATLFGSTAGAGVIQITTRRGSAADGVRFNFRSEYGFNDIERDFGIARHHTFMLDEAGQRFCVQDAYVAGSNKLCSRTVDYRAEVARINNAPGDFALTTVSFPVDPGAVVAGDILRRAFLASSWPGRTYNAVDQLVDPQPTAIQDLSVTGRSGNTSFFASANWTRQEGAVRGLDGYERLGGRLNIEQQIGDQWNLQFTSFFSRGTDDGSNQEEGGTGWFRLTRTPAIVDITQRDSLGRLLIRTNLGSAGTQNENPLYSFENVEREDSRYRYLGSANVRYTPFTWLDVIGNFAVDRLNWNFEQFTNRGFRTTNSSNTAFIGSIFNGVQNNQSLNGGLQATARRQLASELLGRFNVGWSYQQQDFDLRSITGNTLRVSDVTAGANATANQVIASSDNSTRQMSLLGGVFLDYKDRYTMDLAVRRDGSSRFGPENRWQTYGRASAAWLAAREAWWPANVLSQFTLRASYGAAGNSPPFSAQYETYTIGAGGALSAATLGNPQLKPEVVTELETGVDLELFERVGLSVTYAQGLSRNQILPVPVSVSTGFPTQWTNAGTLENKTWEASLTMPFLRRPDLEWSGRLNYTSNRTHIKQLDVPPFDIGTNLQATGNIIRIEEGLRYGTFFGRGYVTSCGQLQAQFSADCGTAGASFQKNDEGYIVWVGQGNDPGMGITHNLWNTALPGAQSPWGVSASWGMPIVIRDANPNDPTLPGSARVIALGNALPDYRIGVSQNLTWKRLSVYGLLDGAFGQSVWNQGRHWSYLDFLSHDVDQAGKSLETAKPIGYYYRAPSPDAGGIGGFYDILTPTARHVEDASYMKLREVAVSYRLGPLGGVGDWSLSLIGRNLKTWTDYSGFDPEVGVGNVPTTTTNQSGSGVVNGIDAFTFPNLRTFSFVVGTSF